MTTIAVSRGLRMMVSDTSITQGGSRLPESPKMWRCKSAIVGISGELLPGEKFAQWVDKREGKRPKGAYDALVLYRDGRVGWFHQGHKEQLINGEFFAIGSGASFALGAFECMDAMGLILDPRIAVRAACKHDVFSVEPIRTLRWVK